MTTRDPPFCAPTVSLQEFVCAAPNGAICAHIITVDCGDPT